MNQSDIIGVLFIAMAACIVRAIRGDRSLAKIVVAFAYGFAASASVLLLAVGAKAILKPISPQYQTVTNLIGLFIDLSALLLLALAALGVRVHRIPGFLSSGVAHVSRRFAGTAREAIRDQPVWTTAILLFLCWLIAATAYLGLGLVLPLVFQCLAYLFVGGAQGLRSRVLWGIAIGILGASSLAFAGAYLDKSSTNGVILLFSAALFCFVQGTFFTEVSPVPHSTADSISR